MRKCCVGSFLGENILLLFQQIIRLEILMRKIAMMELVMRENNCRCVLQIQGARVVDSPSHGRHYVSLKRYADEKRG